MKLKIDIDIETSEELKNRIYAMSHDERCEWIASNCLRNNQRTVNRVEIDSPDQSALYYDPDLVCSKCLTNDQVFYNGAIWHGEEYFDVTDSWCGKCEEEAHMIEPHTKHTAPEDIRYLVVWCLQLPDGGSDDRLFVDKYEAFEDLASAKKRYDEIIQNDDTFSASICVPVNSTDYASPKGDQINALLSA